MGTSRPTLMILIAVAFLGACEEDVTSPEATPDPEVVYAVSMVRPGWWWASLPVRGVDREGASRTAYGPENRAYAGWHLPLGAALKRGHVNPELSEEESREVLTTLELRVHAKDMEAGWKDDEFAGIMTHFGHSLHEEQQPGCDADLTDARFLEFWIDDGTGYVDPTDESALTSGRPGRLHFDFGMINEDFFWRPHWDGSYVLGERDNEDLDGDGLLGIAEDGETEDRGLDRLLDGSESSGQALPGRPSRGQHDPAGDDFDAADTAENTFIYINGTEGNNRLDDEDLDRDGVLDLADGFFRLTLELDDADAYIDPAYVFADDEDFIADLRRNGRSWRKYRLDLRDASVVVRGDDLDDTTPYHGATPYLEHVRVFRIWYEPEGDGSDPAERRIRFADMHFRRHPRP